jgi:hypothetical protein
MDPSTFSSLTSRSRAPARVRPPRPQRHPAQPGQTPRGVEPFRRADQPVEQAGARAFRTPVDDPGLHQRRAVGAQRLLERRARRPVRAHMQHHVHPATPPPIIEPRGASIAAKS